MRPDRAVGPRPAFTLVELLVVLAIIALLIAVLLPGLAASRLGARSLVCGSRLQQLGVGLTMYLNDYRDALPQATGPDFSGRQVIVGALFGGKKGRLPFFGIDTIGAERRPLNRYVIARPVPPDDSGQTVELEEFHSPVDGGGQDLGVPGFERTDSMYDLLGSSYTLNDHAPDTTPGIDLHPTLIPDGGGRMPFVLDPSRTWVIGTHTLYNYDDGGDRGQRWFGRQHVEANLTFLDMHVRTRVRVPRGPVHTTADYTFLPTPWWLER